MRGRRGSVSLVGGLAAVLCALLVALALPALAGAATWSVQVTPAPNDGQTTSNGAFSGISCPTGSTTCVAVGNTFDFPTPEALAELSVSGGWSLLSPALANPVGTPMSSVSCASTTMCMAAGDAAIGLTWPYAEEWNGTTWFPSLAAFPSDILIGSFTSVSCPTTTSCLAVGWYLNTKGVLEPLVNAWGPPGWADEAVTPPSGAAASLLSGVSCQSTTCVAVGTEVTSTGAVEPFSETATSTGSVTQTTPATSGAASLLFGVSCSSSTACTGVGTSVSTTGTLSPLAERFNGRTWTTESTPAPTGSTGSALLGVSCPGSTSCAAVGGSIGSTNVDTLAESWNGTAWSDSATPNPSGELVSELGAISCPSTTSCTAAGESINSSGSSTALAEGLSAGGATVFSARLSDPLAGMASVSRRTLSLSLPFPFGALRSSHGTTAAAIRRTVLATVRARARAARRGS